METPSSNRKAADELHDIRERIRELRDQEQQLRRAFIAGDLPRDGDAYTVVIEVKPNERIDLDAMRERVPESIWKPYVIERPVTYVNVRRKQ